MGKEDCNREADSNSETNHGIETMTAKCPCQHCCGPIGFDAESLLPEMVVECPHCHCETILFIPVPPPMFVPPRIKKTWHPSTKAQFGIAVIGLGLVLAAEDYAKHKTPVQSFCTGMFYSMAVCGIVGAILGFYFLPSLIARKRQKRNLTAIFALNLCLGWTLVGWVVALVWSLLVEPETKGTV